MGSVLVAMLVAQAGLPSKPAASAPQHDGPRAGFLGAFDVGAGYSTFSTAFEKSSGMAITTGVHAGYSFASHFVVGAQLFAAVQPHGQVTPIRSLMLLAVGPELGFLHRGWTFSVTPQFLRVHTSSGIGEKGDHAYEGRGVGLAIARQWPMSRRLSGGLVARGNYAYLGYAYSASRDGFLEVHEKKSISMVAGSLGGLISF